LIAEDVASHDRSTCAVTRDRDRAAERQRGVKKGSERKKRTGRRREKNERKEIFNTEEHISCFTQYNMAVQPSIVIHWKTVSMANPMLSKLVMPEFGPSQRSRHIEVFALHTWAPGGCSTSLSVLHGLGSSPSFTIISATSGTVRYFDIKMMLLGT
jgi:hypothetical protein